MIKLEWGGKKLSILKSAKTALEQIRENSMLPHYTDPSAALLKFLIFGSSLGSRFFSVFSKLNHISCE